MIQSDDDGGGIMTRLLTTRERTFAALDQDIKYYLSALAQLTTFVNRYNVF